MRREASRVLTRNNQLLMEGGGGRCASLCRGLRRCVKRIVQPQSEEGFRHFFKAPSQHLTRAGTPI